MPNSLNWLFKVNFSRLTRITFLVALLFLPSALIASTQTDNLSFSQDLLKAEDHVKQLQLEKEDSLKILPRIEKAKQAQNEGEAKLARELLESCIFDLDWLDSQTMIKPSANENKLTWLEMLFDLLRGYALTAILALFFIKLPWLRAKSHNTRLTSWKTTLLFISVGLIFGWVDITRYGGSAWAYFDIQIILATCAGFLSGGLFGILIGCLFSLARFLVLPDLANGSIALVFSSILGSLFFLAQPSIEKKGLLSCALGITAGIIHSLTIYLPLRQSLPGSYWIMAAAFVAITEAFGIFLFFAVICGLLREEKQKNLAHELTRSQLMFLQAQIKPHFLFNALNTIAAVCRQENAPRSKDLVGRLADFFRHALETQDPVLSIGKELEFVDAYLELEKARFGDELKIVRSIHLDDTAMKVQVPILVIQPIVENAIRHGLRKKSGHGTLTITAEDKTSTLEISIRDDGAGASSEFFENYLKKNIGKAEGHGIGIRNINERLNQFYGKGHWLIFKTISGQGTVVTLTIPKKIKRTQ